mgnify:CR=1 FL=1
MEDREFAFSKSQFNTLVDLVYQETGIVLKEKKYAMVYARLVRRIRALKLNSFQEYVDYLTGPNGKDEIVSFINSITTNLTKFFREDHQFVHLRQTFAAECVEWAKKSGDRRIRIWSAGCSMGLEPYSIAMVLYDCIPAVQDWDIKILATDIDTNVLDIAKAGVYDAKFSDDIPANYRSKFITKSPDKKKILIHPKLKDMIHFKSLNLFSNWPMKGPFDAIFCRNVMIYFDIENRKKLVSRYKSLIKPGGFLYLGHSESLSGREDGLSRDGHATFRKL